MPCFCKHLSLAKITPSSPLPVRDVPPQLMRLLYLLQLAPANVRNDEQLVDRLPKGGLRWIKETLSAQAEGLDIPHRFPPAGGAMMIGMLRLSEAGDVFPLQDPHKLLAAVTQASASLEANLAPQMRSLRALKSKGFDNMANAASLTLALRAEGVCPTTLTGVDVNAEYADSAGRVQVLEAIAADLSATQVPPFRLSASQLSLAQTLAGLATYLDAATSNGLPPLSDLGFIEALKAQVEMLAAVPAPRHSISPIDIGMIADLHNIIQAFGETALTPEGVEQVNGFLRSIAKTKIKIPAEASELSQKIIATPALPHVLMGLEAVQTAGAAIAASAAVTAPKTFGDLPIIEFIERAATLSAVLERTFGKPALLPCNDCLFAIDEISANLSQVQFPDVPRDFIS